MATVGRRNGPGLGIALALAFAVGPGVAQAHPHVFVDVGFGLQFAADGLEAIDVTWRFDDFYSQAMLPDYMQKGERQLSATGVKGLYDDVFRFLGEYRYYTDVTVDGTLMPRVKALGFMARAESGTLVFSFVIPLDRPMVKGQLDLLGFDPDYFIAYALAGPPVIRGKPGPHRCRTRSFARDTDITGPIEVAGLSCTIG